MCCLTRCDVVEGAAPPRPWLSWRPIFWTTARAVGSCLIQCIKTACVFKRPRSRIAAGNDDTYSSWLLLVDMNCLGKRPGRACMWIAQKSSTSCGVNLSRSSTCKNPSTTPPSLAAAFLSSLLLKKASVTKMSMYLPTSFIAPV